MTGRSNDGTVAPPQNGSNPGPRVHASRSAGVEPRHVSPRPSSNLEGEPLPTLVDIQTVSSSLGISMRQVRRFVADGQIPFVRVGHLIRFDPGEVKEWIDVRRSR